MSKWLIFIRNKHTLYTLNGHKNAKDRCGKEIFEGGGIDRFERESIRGNTETLM